MVGIKIVMILHFLLSFLCGSYISFLNEKYRALGLGKYQKNSIATFDILMNYGDSKLASRYARRLIEEHKNCSLADIASGTKVYELVEELAKYLPENVKEKFI